MTQRRLVSSHVSLAKRYQEYLYFVKQWWIAALFCENYPLWKWSHIWGNVWPQSWMEAVEEFRTPFQLTVRYQGRTTK